MTDADILKILQADLNILAPDATRTAQMEQYIAAAKEFIKREGVDLTTPYSIEDGQLIEMYAAYLFRKRDSDTGMPRMLRWALNNRIFSRKESDPDAAG